MKEQLNHLFLYIETPEECEAAWHTECLKYLTLEGGAKMAEE